jgi:hypothetical protein
MYYYSSFLGNKKIEIYIVSRSLNNTLFRVILSLLLWVYKNILSQRVFYYGLFFHGLFL